MDNSMRMLFLLMTSSPRVQEWYADWERAGAPDTKGIRRVCGDVHPPKRLDAPQNQPKTGEPGVALVRAVIGRTGVVGDVTVIWSLSELRDDVLRAVRQWRFAPATLDGKPVAVRIVLDVPVTRH